jgi:hypothetical protein
MSVRSVLGMVVVIAGLALTGAVIERALKGSMDTAQQAWTTPAVPAP